MPVDISKILSSLPPVLTVPVFLLAMGYLFFLTRRTLFEAQRASFEAKKLAHEVRTLEKSGETESVASSSLSVRNMSVGERPVGGKRIAVFLTKSETWTILPYLFFLLCCFILVGFGADSLPRIASMLLYGFTFTWVLQLVIMLVVLRFLTAWVKGPKSGSSKSAPNPDSQSEID